MSDGIAEEEERLPGVGALLRASRLRCGEDLRDVADSLCIRFLYLEAIEEGRYQDLPGSTYAVGFIRAYADHLGLDSEEVVRLFKAEQSGIKRRDDLVFPTPVPERVIPRGAVVFVGLLIAVVAYGAWYLSSTREGGLGELIAPIPERLSALLDGDKAASPAADAPPTDTPAASAGNETTGAAAPLPAEPPEATSTDEPTAAGNGAVEPMAEPMAPVTAATPAAAPAATEESAASPATPSPSDEPASPTSSEPEAVEPQADTATDGATAETGEPAAATPAPDASTASAPAAATPTTEATTAETPAAETESPVPETGAATTAGDAAEAPSETTDTAADTAATDTSDTAAPASQEEAVEVATAPAAEESDGESADRIRFRAKSDIWIQVLDAEGGEVVTRLLKAGSTYTVPERSGLKLYTSNAGGIEILVGDDVVPAIGSEGDVVRGALMDAQKLRAGEALP